MSEACNFIETSIGRPTTLLKKRDSGTGVFPGTGVFLWILRNIQEHFLYRTPPVVFVFFVVTLFRDGVFYP